MGAIVRRGTKHKPRLYAQYKDANGVRRTKRLKGAKTTEEANTLLASIELNITQGKAGLEQPTPEQQERASVTVKKLSEKFLKEYAPPGIKSIKNYRRDAGSILKVRIGPAFGSRAAAAITTADVERFRDSLSIKPLELAGASVTQTLAILSKVYSWGRRAGIIECANPAQGVERPRATLSIDYLDSAEVGQLLAKAEELALAPGATWEARTRAPMVAAAIYSGMRKGELFGLKWTDVNLEAGRLDVMHSYTLLPKGGKARYLPLHPELARVLRLWKRVCPKTREQVVFSVEPEPGRFRMGSRFDSLGLTTLLAEAECHGPADGKPWHMLRHTFASHAVMSGTSLYEVQRLLGHATPQMTQRYAHLAPDHLAASVARLRFAAPSPAGISDMGEERRKRAADQS